MAHGMHEWGAWMEVGMTRPNVRQGEADDQKQRIRRTPLA